MEVPVGRVDEFPVGTMKEIVINEDDPNAKILLIRTAGGEFRATSSRCTHYGAPLVKGVLSGDSVICPFHNACFNTCTGDIEDMPAMKPIHVYSVGVSGFCCMECLFVYPT